ncbi:MAG TPA: L,D-transpeptidase [Cryptosporangiaceae bacterium]|nr:L,D-transpeptidase [Cryptosporangiaceae bacterium]
MTAAAPDPSPVTRPGSHRRVRPQLWLPIVGAVLVVVVAVALIVVMRTPGQAPARPVGPAVAVPSPSPSAPPAKKAFVVVPPPAGLPVVDYDPAPAGFPADPAPLSTAPLREGLHATRLIGAYDAPGGRPVAFLAPDIRGVELTMPIVERRSGWAAVLVPSTNRKIAWVPPGGWTTVVLRDQIIVRRKTHRLTWYRDGQLMRSWPVTLGVPATPTPLGRTFIIGRSALRGAVYAGTDVLALGSVPDDPSALPPALRGAHTGIHTWHHDRALGKNTSDGCIRLTKSGQQLLLRELRGGTEVVVLD